MAAAAPATQAAIQPAMPQRPARPLSTLQLVRVAISNTLAACDEELFDEPLVERRFIWGRVFVVSDPAGIRRVMQDNVDNYPRIMPIRRVFAFTAGTGMLSAEGEVWRRHRRLLNPTLDNRAALADLPMLVDASEALAARLAQVPAGQQIDVRAAFAGFVTSVTGRMFAHDAREIDPFMMRLGRYPGKYRLRDFVELPRWVRLSGKAPKRDGDVAAFLPLLDRLIAARRDPNYRGDHDLLWRIVHASGRDSGDGLDMAEIRDEALTLGTTSATPIRVFPWLWYLLALHPQSEARLHDELDRVLGGRMPTADDLPHLVYLRQVIDETLRLYPPAPTMLRTALADDVIGGHRVPRKSVIGVFPWVVHRHRKLWADPDSFDPGRFARDQVASRSRYAYIPFAIGPHVCIGASLALVELTVAVAVVAQRFRFRLVPGQRIEPVAWTNLHARGGIKMTVEPRAAVG